MLTEALYGKQEYTDLFSPFCSPLPWRMLEIKKKYKRIEFNFNALYKNLLLN